MKLLIPMFYKKFILVTMEFSEENSIIGSILEPKCKLSSVFIPINIGINTELCFPFGSCIEPMFEFSPVDSIVTTPLSLARYISYISK